LPIGIISSFWSTPAAAKQYKLLHSNEDTLTVLPIYLRMPVPSSSVQFKLTSTPFADGLPKMLINFIIFAYFLSFLVGMKGGNLR